MRKADRQLLTHYAACGAEPWNRSTEEAWLAFELRAWVEPRLPAGPSLRACNIGIGTGHWDDWLGDTLAPGATLVSVDRDPEICRIFALRQARERHPRPAEVVCGDVLDGALGGRRFDVITIVGTTLRENGARRGDVEQAAMAALAPGGVLLIAEALPAGEPTPPGADVRRFRDTLLACRSVMPA